MNGARGGNLAVYDLALAVSALINLADGVLAQEGEIAGHFGQFFPGKELSLRGSGRRAMGYQRIFFAFCSLQRIFWAGGGEG